MSHIAKVSDRVNIWYETFGKSEDPAVLLIMGACCQGICWPTEFCQKLASKGFFVIRYDHRDAGMSTCFDFDKDPYSLTDMAQDAWGLLEHLHIERTHILGLSSGGAIAQLMAAGNPKRISSIALMATSHEFSPLDLALFGKKPNENSLSGPKELYLKAMDNFIDNPPQTEEENLEQRIAIWNILNGNAFPLDKEQNREMHTLFLKRLNHKAGLENHLKANCLSEDELRASVSKIHVPTVIFLGNEDPIFGLDHGKAQHALIQDSLYYEVEGMGHVPNPKFDTFIIDKFIENISR